MALIKKITRIFVISLNSLNNLKTIQMRILLNGKKANLIEPKIQNYFHICDEVRFCDFSSFQQKQNQECHKSIQKVEINHSKVFTIFRQSKKKARIYSGRRYMTPELAGDIVRKLRLSNDTLLLDESSSSSLIQSLRQINTVWLEQNEIDGKSRMTLLLVLECYANAVPGELTYQCDDEEQARIIHAALIAYNNFQ